MSSWRRGAGSIMQRQEELIGEHLDYEIKMLHEMRKFLRGEPVSADMIANAVMESFCLHARNLNEFFLENSNRVDTLKASSFATSNYRKPPNPDDRRALFQKINKQISHLTTERTSIPEEKIGNADREEMYGWIFGLLEYFGKHVRSELQSVWKIRVAVPRILATARVANCCKGVECPSVVLNAKAFTPCNTAAVGSATKARGTPLFRGVSFS